LLTCMFLAITGAISAPMLLRYQPNGIFAHRIQQ
jgi:hypothetical protein